MEWLSPETQWTDHEAAALARRGNHSAFRVLVERHSQTIFRLALRMSGHQQDAEDLVQETFLRAYKQMPNFDARSAFVTWLYRIAVNCSIDLIRARKLRQENHPPPLVGADFSNWLEHVAASDPSPERLSHSSEIAALLEPAIQQLTDTERAAFILRHYEGCGIEQIAAILNVQPNSAKQSIFRAVQKLRRALQPVQNLAYRGTK